MYVNYAFTLVWLFDVAWWWTRQDYRARPRWLDWTIHGFLSFIVFNATVIFASGFSRWFGIAACLMLPVMILWPKTRRSDVDANHH